MLTAEQLRQFKTFGFVILRSVFTNDEIKTIREEFDHRAAEASSYEPFDGSKIQNFNMMGDDTPFFASLLEDPRFADTAEQMYGEVLGRGAEAYRYVSNTFWHFDPGCYEAHGVNFGIYLQPLRTDTGALRLVPGSHLRPWSDELDGRSPLSYAWVRQDRKRAAGNDVIRSVPGYACETDPGDVVAFDDRFYHASAGGSTDRHLCDITYLNYPKSP